jgi:hypothetical protein
VFAVNVEELHLSVTVEMCSISTSRFGSSVGCEFRDAQCEYLDDPLEIPKPAQYKSPGPSSTATARSNRCQTPEHVRRLLPRRPSKQSVVTEN